ncbi:MAG: alpha/beta hydrolase [Sphingomonadales bacterium]|nr:alpha/beta hydrolase [Sphingomonadales bacterium]
MSPVFTDSTFKSDDGLNLYFRDYAARSGAHTPVLCLTGLTRNCRDYENLAPHISRHHRVICPDPRGRGRSDYDPTAENYHPGTYVQDTFKLLGLLAVERVIIIGTSMGGLMAMIMSAMAPERIAAVVLNDVGPEVAEEGIERIKSYVGMPTVSADWGKATALVRASAAELYPDFDDADWLRFTRRIFREDGSGKIAPDYDLKIADGLAAGSAVPPDLWPLFDAVSQRPLLVIRGAHSDILSADTLARMQERNPEMQVAVVPDRGHAPTLDEPAAVAAIDAFLAALRAAT